jgi:hypothetical protein
MAVAFTNVVEDGNGNHVYNTCPLALMLGLIDGRADFEGVCAARSAPGART